MHYILSYIWAEGNFPRVFFFYISDSYLVENLSTHVIPSCLTFHDKAESM